MRKIVAECDDKAAVCESSDESHLDCFESFDESLTVDEEEIPDEIYNTKIGVIMRHMKGLVALEASRQRQKQRKEIRLSTILWTILN